MPDSERWVSVRMVTLLGVFFFFQAEDGIRDVAVTGVQTCALPISGLARQIVLSPVAGDVRVSWHRSAIHVKPAEGWKPNRVYHLELLSGIVDLQIGRASCRERV